MSNPSTNHSETSLAVTLITLGAGKMIEWLVHAEHALASLSYLVAILAGLVTLYYKIKNKK